MSYILHLETATDVCSVALSQVKEDLPQLAEPITVAECTEPRKHSEELLPLICSVIKKAGIGFNDLAAVAVSRGPGSYTGLRIGVSTAKGICFALNIPLISVDTMLSLALGAKVILKGRDGILCPMLDARRMEVYCGFYDFGGFPLETVKAEIIEPDFISKRRTGRHITADFFLFGDGAEKSKSMLKLQPGVEFVENFKVSASALVAPAFEKFKAKEFESTAHFEPYYLKEFMATVARDPLR